MGEGVSGCTALPSDEIKGCVLPRTVVTEDARVNGTDKNFCPCGSGISILKDLFCTRNCPMHFIDIIPFNHCIDPTMQRALLALFLPAEKMGHRAMRHCVHHLTGMQ